MNGPMSRRENRPSGLWEDSPLGAMRQEMDQLFSRFFGGGRSMGEIAVGSPSLDLSETDNDIEVRMDLPGFKKDEIDVKLNGDVLTISGEHSQQSEQKDDGRRFHRIERHHGSFRRTVQLPAVVKDEGIDASFRDGVLTIRMPKAEESTPRKITINE